MHSSHTKLLLKVIYTQPLAFFILHILCIQLCTQTTQSTSNINKCDTYCFHPVSVVFYQRNIFQDKTPLNIIFKMPKMPKIVVYSNFTRHRNCHFGNVKRMLQTHTFLCCLLSFRFHSLRAMIGVVLKNALLETAN